ncbi:MAG: undecaprenyl/decaprenyl-phosphate alpha-N-acetylglucosaminyl 1-phosphate transferase [Desulfuromonadales bacterium]|nr:undecaprenyl/decaprenyl-phosphate alpha-N-acetylglucosaminyl 1-phosphate transferase [Desulfuromonadales bacterium]
MDLNQSFYIFMTALFSSLIMVPFLRRWAIDSGTTDTPDGRKVHTQAIPRIGGVAISMAFLFTMLVHVPMVREVRGILAGTLIIFFTGLVDDLYGLTPRRKFLGEIGACLVTMTVGHLYLSRLGNLFGTGEVLLPVWLAVPLTLFAVVGVINAINLIDGLDGLAGGVSVIALTAFFVLALQSGDADTAAVTMGLLGGVLGFLKYNFYPARIFMGDVGSLVTGFILGFTAILLTQSPGATISPMVPVLILGVPIIDTVWVMIRRTLQGSSPFAPDMTHVHHKFLNLGFQHRFTVLVIYGISLFWATFAVVGRNLPEYLLLGTFVVVCSVAYGILRYVLNRRARFSLLALDSPRGLRESVTYQRLVERADALIPGLIGLVLLYLTCVALAGGGLGYMGPMGAVLLAAGIALLYYTRDPANDFLLSMLFLAALAITFAAERSGGRQLISGMTLGGFSDLLFLAVGLLVLAKLLLRRPGEFFLSTADYLVLGLAVFLGFALPEIGVPSFFIAALPKGVVLFLAVKTVAVKGRPQAHLAVSSVLALLAVITAKSFLGL